MVLRLETEAANWHNKYTSTLGSSQEMEQLIFNLKKHIEDDNKSAKASIEVSGAIGKLQRLWNLFKGTGTRDLIWLKVVSLDRSWLVGLTDDL